MHSNLNNDHINVYNQGELNNNIEIYQTGNNLYPTYDQSNNSYQIVPNSETNNNNNIINNNVPTNIIHNIPLESHQVINSNNQNQDFLNGNNQLNNYYYNYTNGISNTENNNIISDYNMSNINNEINMNGMNVINNNNQIYSTNHQYQSEIGITQENNINNYQNISNLSSAPNDTQNHKQPNIKVDPSDNNKNKIKKK